MRLICPNCGAQYEVDGSMIPPEGRDVQCSNCAQTWFQEPETGPLTLPEALKEPEAAPSDQDAESISDQAAETPQPAETPPTDQPESAIEDAQPESDAAPPLSGAAEQAEPDAVPEDDDDAIVAGEDMPLPRKPSEQLEENILGILKEEAEREAQARRAEEPAGLETQPDLGIDDVGGDEVSAGVAAHLAGARMQDVGEDVDSQAGARSDLLPDIEEINSSLRPASQHSEVQEIADPAIAEGRQRRGFRLGFTLIVVIVAVLILAYVFAPQLAEQVPQAETALTLYVDMANGIRDGIEGLMGQAIDGLSGSETDAE